MSRRLSTATPPTPFGRQTHSTMTNSTESQLAQQFSQAQNLQNQGQIQPAILIYQEILAAAPDHAGTLEAMGVLAAQTNNLQVAVQYFDQLVAVRPSYSSAHCNRGNTLRLLGQRDAALVSFQKAIALDPNNAVAHYSCGETYTDLGRTEEALASYGRAVALNPGFVQAAFRRGLLLQETGRLEEASTCYSEILRLQPTHLNSLANQALVLAALGRSNEALACCDSLIALQPQQGALHSLRAKVLTTVGRPEEALTSHERACTLDPGSPQVHYDLGVCFMLLGRLRDAISSFDSAIALKPDYAEAYYDRGRAACSLGRFSVAIADLKTVATLAPNLEYLPGLRLQSSLPICDWADYDSISARIIAGIRKGERVVNPFIFMALSDSAPLQHAAAQIWMQHRCPPNDLLGPIARRERPRKLTIGYFSADLGENHPVGRLMVEVLELHERSRFEVIAFSSNLKKPDGTEQRLVRAVDRFIDVASKSNVEVASLARSLNVDIAVDLGGYTQDSRPDVMALRAAPVQIGYLGYLGTTGASYMDYILADPTVVTADTERHYSEQVIYLPDSHQANPSKRHIADKVFTRKELRLPAKGFVFCCFNTVYKISPTTFAGWMRILDAVPGSVLFVYVDHEDTVHNLRAHAARAGVNPDRIVFGDRMRPELYLARYRVVDLFLDTFPYNAGTTASDALWCGIPVVTLTGEAFASRIAASLLNALGVPELITSTQQHYEQLAIELGSNPKRYAQIKARIQANRSTSPLFDSQRFTRNLEAAFTAAYDLYQAGQPPKHIRV
jgi:predicted O-linked N-acetylglucosamine transferase (SPINDLY family)